MGIHAGREVAGTDRGETTAAVVEKATLEAPWGGWEGLARGMRTQSAVQDTAT